MSRNRVAGLDINFDLRIHSVVNMTNQVTSDNRDSAAHAWRYAGDFPLHLGSILWYATVHFFLKKLSNLLPTLGPLGRSSHHGAVDEL